jgi:hypothetical protein
MSAMVACTTVSIVIPNDLLDDLGITSEQVERAAGRLQNALWDEEVMGVMISVERVA